MSKLLPTISEFSTVLPVAFSMIRLPWKRSSDVQEVVESVEEKKARLLGLEKKIEKIQKLIEVGFRNELFFFDHVDAKFRAVLDLLPDIILIVASNEKILFCNRRCSEFLGAEHPRDVYGLRCSEIIFHDHEGFIREWRQRVAGGETLSTEWIEWDIQGLDGSIKHVTSTAIPIIWEGIEAVLIRAMDAQVCNVVCPKREGE